jgi:hypothetical protein
MFQVPNSQTDTDQGTDGVRTPALEIEKLSPMIS